MRGRENKGRGRKNEKSTKWSDEVTALLRLTQMMASGAEVDIVNTIGKYECSKFPPSLFDETGKMRATGTKSRLFKCMIADLQTSCESPLPSPHMRTAIIVDVMHVIRNLSFHKGESFAAIADRYKHHLLNDVPQNTCVVHLCCDRYWSPSLKDAEREDRASKVKQSKMYEVKDHFQAPEPSEFFPISANKEQLLQYLCERWA